MINKTVSLLLSIVIMAAGQVKYPQTVKILSIGNSFSQNALFYLYDMGESAGVNLVIGNLYYSGSSLEIHENNARKNLKAYSYQKWSSQGMTKEMDKTMKEVLLDENWDYITFQQSSEYSGLYDTFQPHLNYLIDYVKSMRPDAKLALNMTWAYAEDSNNNGFSLYDYNQDRMYQNIVQAYRQALKETEIDILIPCGTAIQNSRTHDPLNAIGDQLTSDGYHLDKGMGRYIAGLTFFQALLAGDKNLDVDIYEDISFLPALIGDKEDLVEAAKKAVVEAVKNPYGVTKIRAD